MRKKISLPFDLLWFKCYTHLGDIRVFYYKKFATYNSQLGFAFAARVIYYSQGEPILVESTLNY